MEDIYLGKMGSFSQLHGYAIKPLTNKPLGYATMSTPLLLTKSPGN